VPVCSALNKAPCWSIRAGTTMNEVVTSIRRVTDIMGEISVASNEQSLGVSQVGEAVTQMDQVTQQNAALVEQIAAAATSLKSQADDLVQSVSIFQTGQERQRQSGCLANRPGSLARPCQQLQRLRPACRRRAQRCCGTQRAAPCCQHTRPDPPWQPRRPNLPHPLPRPATLTGKPFSPHRRWGGCWPPPPARRYRKHRVS
jgi:hypothetical protein